MATPHTAIPLPLDALAEFCRKWRIAKLEVFGSILTDEFGPESDVDFLYTWEPGGAVGLAFLDMQEELAAIIGRPVDLVSRPGIERSHNYLRRALILEHAAVVYEQAA